MERNIRRHPKIISKLCHLQMLSAREVEGYSCGIAEAAFSRQIKIGVFRFRQAPKFSRMSTKFEFQGTHSTENLTGDCNGERIQLQKLRRTAAVSQHQEGLPSKPSGAGSVGRGGTAEWISFCPRGKRRIWSLCREMHEPDFSVLRIGNRMVVPKERFIQWVKEHTGGGAA